MEAGAGVEGKCQGAVLSEGGEGGIKAASRVSGLNNWVDSGSTWCCAEHREWNRSGEGEKRWCLAGSVSSLMCRTPVGTRRKIQGWGIMCGNHERT